MNKNFKITRNFIPSNWSVYYGIYKIFRNYIVLYSIFGIFIFVF